MLLLRPRRLAAEGCEVAVREGGDESDVSALCPGWTEAAEDDGEEETSVFFDLNLRRSNMAAGKGGDRRRWRTEQSAVVERAAGTHERRTEEMGAEAPQSRGKVKESRAKGKTKDGQAKQRKDNRQV